MESRAIRPKVSVFWFRRDLRLDDNAGLAEALASGNPVVPIFIFDDDILHRLEDRDDARVGFLVRAVASLQDELVALGSGLRVERGRPVDVWTKLLNEFDVRAAYACEDYEPYAIERDGAIRKVLEARGATFSLVKDQVVFAKREVAKDDGSPYSVFTPYSRKWKSRVQPERDLAPRPSRQRLSKLFPFAAPAPVVSLEALGFEPSRIEIPSAKLDLGLVARYAKSRDIMGQRGTTRLGLHLRFGTVSPRHLAREAWTLGAAGETWLNELIWREFFMQILWNFPHVVEGPFRREYSAIQWRNDENEFQKWMDGETGYPVVDAGMRELAATGFMHNRARMVVASFLTKHLLIDWQWGEAWFARKLLDFELASNNGNWQWAAGCGCDAAPYFRVFNPELQAKKFDADGAYVKRWVPEASGRGYVKPIVDHAMARQRALATYGSGLGKQAPIPADRA